MPLLTQRRQETEQCSFCHKPKEAVTKLISSPSDYPRAYICDECVLVCAQVLEDKPDPFMDNPYLMEFLEAAEDWNLHESEGKDASAQLARMRKIADLMFGGPDNFSPQEG